MQKNENHPSEALLNEAKSIVKSYVENSGADGVVLNELYSSLNYFGNMWEDKIFEIQGSVEKAIILLTHPKVNQIASKIFNGYNKEIGLDLSFVNDFFIELKSNMCYAEIQLNELSNYSHIMDEEQLKSIIKEYTQKLKRLTSEKG